MIEIFEKIQHDLSFAHAGVREALHKSSAVEALLIYELLELVAKAERGTAAILDALKADAKTKQGGRT